jgi:hypothetical protein
MAPAITPQSGGTARTLLSKLSVKAESGSSTYERAKFKHWIDADHDCQNTTCRGLKSESKTTPTYSSSKQCTIAQGKWYSSHDGATWTNPAGVDIDHV